MVEERVEKKEEMKREEAMGEGKGPRVFLSRLGFATTTPNCDIFILSACILVSLLVVFLHCLLVLLFPRRCGFCRVVNRPSSCTNIEASPASANLGADLECIFVTAVTYEDGSPFEICDIWKDPDCAIGRILVVRMNYQLGY